MSSTLRKVLIVGTALGIGEQLLGLLPEPKPPRQKTPADLRALADAMAKRERREEKRRRKA